MRFVSLLSVILLIFNFILGIKEDCLLNVTSTFCLTALLTLSTLTSTKESEEEGLGVKTSTVTQEDKFAADVVKGVRCVHCKHATLSNICPPYCDKHKRIVKEEGFCSDGKRRDNSATD